MFNGTDRSLVVVAGNGITLTIGDAEQILHPGDPPIRFDGAAAASPASLKARSLIFTNRDMVVHQVKRLQTGTIIDADHLMAVFGLEPAMLQIDGEPYGLRRWETLIDITAAEVGVVSGEILAVFIEERGRMTQAADAASFAQC